MNETAKRSPEFYEFMEFLREGTKRTDAELKKHREEFEVEMKKSREEYEERQRQADERFEAERKKHREEFEAELKKSRVEYEKRQGKNEAWLQNFQHSINETKKIQDEQNKVLYNMGLYAGFSAEEHFYWALKVNPVVGTMKFDTVQRNVQDYDNCSELDIVLTNGEARLVLEVKHRCRAGDLHRILQKTVHSAKSHYQGDKKLYFGLATMSTYPKLIKTAEELGIFLLTAKGEVVEVCNEKVRSF